MLGWRVQSGQAVKTFLLFLLALCDRLPQEPFWRRPHGVAPLALLLRPGVGRRHGHWREREMEGCSLHLLALTCV